MVIDTSYDNIAGPKTTIILYKVDTVKKLEELHLLSLKLYYEQRANPSATTHHYYEHLVYDHRLWLIIILLALHVMTLFIAILYGATWLHNTMLYDA